MPEDTCNAIKRVGNKQFICTEETAHLRKMGTPHRDGDFTWKDDSGSYPGETPVEA